MVQWSMFLFYGGGFFFVSFSVSLVPTIVDSPLFVFISFRLVEKLLTSLGGKGNDSTVTV